MSVASLCAALKRLESGPGLIPVSDRAYSVLFHIDLNFQVLAMTVLLLYKPEKKQQTKHSNQLMNG